ncbi:hypothetical protein B0H12DRAFT_1231054 [Mycena haematopus]|nr:hypothetical protein B0H12DRAFT_1231054 [Mycena haematopus]
MPFVPGHFRAPYLDVPTLRKQPPIFPEVTTNLFLDYLRFRQVLLLRILPNLRKLCGNISYASRHIPFLTVMFLAYSALLCMGSPITILGVTTLPSCSRATSANFQYSCTSSTSYFRTALCAQDVPTTSAFLGNLRFPAVPPLSHGTSAFPRFVLRPRRFSAPGNASQTSCNEVLLSIPYFSGLL